MFSQVIGILRNPSYRYAKNCIQTGMKIQLNPLVAFRGYGVNFASVAPITAFQVGATSAFYKTLFNPKEGQAPTPFQTAISALCAGFLSGSLSGPSESIILQQQQTGKGAGATYRDMVARAGVKGLFRGTQFAMAREAIYTAGYMALGPTCIDQARDMGLSDFTARLAGGIVAGVTAAVVSHPCDTLKTFYQNDFEGKQLPNLKAAINHGNLFKGLLPRMTRLTIGTVIIANTNDVLTRGYMKHFPKENDNVNKMAL